MGIFYNYTDSTYIVSTFDKVIKATVTASGDVVSDWINEMILLIHRHNLDHLIVGLDLEWCPHGFHGTCGENPVALIQLCVGGRCLVFQLRNRDYIPVKFNDFLLDDRFRFVGVRIRDDLEKLKCQ